MRLSVFVHLVVIVTLSASTSRADTLHLCGAGLNLEYDAAKQTFRQPVIGSGEGGGGLVVYDGQKKENVTLRMIEAARHPLWTMVSESEDKSLDFVQSVETKGLWISWKVTVLNSGKEERRLQLTLAIPTSLARDSSRFWDGYLETATRAGLRARNNLEFTFPASCVYDARGVALGINPLHDYSYIQSEVAPLGSPNRLGLEYAVRMVLEPRAKTTVEFVLFGFPAKHGWLEVVQRYYDCFPESFSPTPGIDPHICGNGRYFYGSNGRRHLLLEYTRRFHTDWDWSYGVFQTPGDWYPDEKFWINAKGYPGEADYHNNRSKGTIEEYRRATRERFREGRKSGAMLFYMLPRNCDEMLVEKHFPDSYFYDAAGRKNLTLEAGIKSSTDRNINAWFAGGTSYGKEVRRDMERIVSDFKPSGFAFDNGYGAVMYGGPAQKGMRGRSWTDSGTVVADGMATAELADWIHGRKVDGYRLGMVVNHPQTYTVARCADTVMFEPSAFREQHFKARRIPTRLLSGRKIISLHKGFNEAEDMLRWKELTLDQIVEALKGVVDYQLLWSLKWGAFPSRDIYGVKKVHDWAPMLLELLRRGWQPVSATTADERLWTSRYGEAIDSFIALGNPTRQTIQSPVAIDGTYLGSGNFLFCSYDGKPIACEFRDETICLSEEFPPHEARVYRAVAAIDGPPLHLKGSVSFEPLPLRKGTLLADIELENPQTRMIRFRLPARAKAGVVRFNGQKVKEWIQKDSFIHLGPIALSNHNRFELIYEPDVIVGQDPDQICKLPYITAEKPNCVIVCDADNAVSAQRISAYFEYWHLCRKYPDGEVMNLKGEGPRIPILKSDEVPSDASLIIVVGCPQSNPTLARFTPEIPAGTAVLDLRTAANTTFLLTAGADRSATERAVLRLLYILDEKYPFYGAVPESPMFTKAGLAGKVLVH